ncbi:hypothetical protein [Pseudomonas sp. H3(2019)]|uniref:hypothetical protein n=1 Tax=Pseudomonas sp. H3(2019) TaxID=2598724 RepID=UPI001191BA77|nr:hypothetical protein [Pseudomonas sp. H3(2019)]TVT79418.1 hypothetical protein FPT12_26440 [Pseudomonas sp. H3(2019)]
MSINEEIQRIRDLIANGAEHTIVQNADLPPKPDISLVEGGKLKFSEVPDSGLVVMLRYSGFQAFDKVVFNLAGESPDDTFAKSWDLIGEGTIEFIVPKAELEKFLGSYALALYFIYRVNDNQTSNWTYFDVIP